MYVLSTKTSGKPKLSLFGYPSPAVEQFREWIEEEVSGVKKSGKRSMGGIAFLYARNFHQIALDPKRDVVLLIAVPGMAKYAEAEKIVAQLADVFKPVKTIEFYEFNPRTQMVPGLQIPRSDKPLLSVWPAHSDASGASFPLSIGLQAVFENLMRMVKSQISPTLLRGMNEKIAKLSKE
jgi:hypothetical protein